MKILHYMFGIPPVRGGGSIRYATDLMEQERKMGHEAMLLIPGAIPWNKNRKVRVDQTANYGNVPAYAIFNPLPIPMGNGIQEIAVFTTPCDSQVYRRFLTMLQPDVIHIHSLMGLHREFIQQAEILHIPVLFTTHDYFGICPTVNLLSEGRICEDKEWKSCARCCAQAYSWKKLRLEQSKAYRFYRKHACLVRFVHHHRLRIIFQPLMALGLSGTKQEKKINIRQRMQTNYTVLKNYYTEMFRKVDCFHFNSTTAEYMYRARLGNITGIVEPVSHSGIRDRRQRRSYGHTLRIGYFGGWQEHKGAWLLLEACRQLQEEGCQDIELHIYTDTEEKNFSADARRQELPVHGTFFKRHPLFAQTQFPKVLNSLDILAVPGIWPETFGLVVLEAVSCGVPVVLSKYTGAKDLLKENPCAGFLYDGTLQGLKETLKRIYWNRGLLKKANESILQMNLDVSFALHTEKMLDLYQKLADRTM